MQWLKHDWVSIDNLADPTRTDNLTVAPTRPTQVHCLVAGAEIGVGGVEFGHDALLCFGFLP